MSLVTWQRESFAFAAIAVYASRIGADCPTQELPDCSSHRRRPGHSSMRTCRQDRETTSRHRDMHLAGPTEREPVVGWVAPTPGPQPPLKRFHDAVPSRPPVAVAMPPRLLTR